MMYKYWHKSQINPNFHIYGILAANWLMDLHQISQSFLSLFAQLTEPISHAITNIWHPMLLSDTFLDFKSNKEDANLPRSLFSMFIPFSKIRYFILNNYIIFTMPYQFHLQITNLTLQNMKISLLHATKMDFRIFVTLRISYTG